MRKAVVFIVIISHLLITFGYVLPIVINKYIKYNDKKELSKKLNHLPARTNILHALGEMAKHHQKENQSKPVSDSPAPIFSAFTFMKTDNDPLKFDNPSSTHFSDYISIAPLSVLLDLTSPPPKAIF